MAIDERRSKVERRSGKDRRSGMDTRTEEEKRRVGERRSMIGRRSGLINDRTANQTSSVSDYCPAIAEVARVLLRCSRYGCPKPASSA